MTIAVAADHAGFALKEAVSEMLTAEGHTVLDLGTNNENSVDYPDYGHAIATAILDGKAEIGIAVCGSGIGIAMAANRHLGVRAAVCHSAETARLARQHNDANVLALGSRLMDGELAKDCVRAFLATDFEGGRHIARVAKIDNKDGQAPVHLREVK